MSRKALELLQMVGLLKGNYEVADLACFDQQSLIKKVQYYTAKRIEQAEQDATENRSGEKDLASLLSSVSGRNEVTQLLPSALVLTRIFTNDPLFRFGLQPDQFARVYKRVLGLSENASPELWQIDNALAYFSKLAPLIKDGIIVVLPLDVVHEPSEHRAINFSEDALRSQVPDRLHDLVHQEAVIYPMTPGPDGALIIRKTPATEPGRGIAIRFRDDEVNRASFFQLSDTKVLGEDQDGNMKIAQTLDWSDKPSKEYYDHWVYQSINRETIERLKSISRETSLASKLGAYYMTESKFEAKLCGLDSAATVEPQARTDAVKFLRANAPYLKIDSADAVARIRADKSDLFERFRLSLLAVSAELEGMDAGFEERAKQLFEKEIQPQVEEISIALTKAKTAFVKGGILAASSIALAILTGGNLPVVSLLGIGAAQTVGEAVTEIAEYRKRRRGPAFIWKQITK